MTNKYEIGDLINENKIVSKTIGICPFDTAVQVNNLAGWCKKFGDCDPRRREDCEILLSSEEEGNKESSKA